MTKTNPEAMKTLYSLSDIPDYLKNRLKIRCESGYANIDSLRAEMDRYGMYLSNDLLEEFRGTVLNQSIPNRCKGCSWNKVCNYEDIYRANPGIRICTSFTDVKIPTWKLNFKLTGNHGYGYELLVFEGGLLKTLNKAAIAYLLKTDETDNLLQDRIVSKHEALEFAQKILTNKKNLILKDGETIPYSIKYRINIEVYKKPEHLEGLYIRPAKGETIEEYKVRVKEITDKSYELYEEALNSENKQSSAEERLKEVLRIIGLSDILSLHYNGDVTWMAQDYWPGMTIDEIDRHYSAKITGVSIKREDFVLQAIKEVK